jgi:hypothetical protein
MLLSFIVSGIGMDSPRSMSAPSQPPSRRLGNPQKAWMVKCTSRRILKPLSFALSKPAAASNVIGPGELIAGHAIGATLAADALKERITHLVLNDIGPDTPSTAADRIADYVGHPPIVKTMAELEAWYRTNYAPFGSNTDAFWRRLTENSMRRTDDGMITVHYDPGIAGPFRAGLRDLDVWPAYDRVTAKTGGQRRQNIATG